MAEKKKILVLIDWFDPAFRAGGPITSCVNFVNAFCTIYSIKILTSAYDIDNTMILESEYQSRWVKYGAGAEVYYARKEELNYRFISTVIEREQPDFLYCNSMFSIHFTIYPFLIKIRNKTLAKIVLAPRGMLKPSALAYKRLKKLAFLSVVKFSGIPSKLRFHATDLEEQRDITTKFGITDNLIAGNIPAPIGLRPVLTSKKVGQLNILFLGRVHPIKQLDYLLDCLMHVQGDVNLTIIGPLEDSDYWKTCQSKINNLTANISVEYLGERNPSEIKLIFSKQHVMALPTKGENFGHAIFESFVQGKPVIISDRTPWRNLKKEKTGFDCDLDSPNNFLEGLQSFIEMDEEEYLLWSGNAYDKAEKFVTESGLVDKYIKLFS